MIYSLVCNLTQKGVNTCSANVSYKLVHVRVFTVKFGYGLPICLYRNVFHIALA